MLLKCKHAALRSKHILDGKLSSSRWTDSDTCRCRLKWLHCWQRFERSRAQRMASNAMMQERNAACTDHTAKGCAHRQEPIHLSWALPAENFAAAKGCARMQEPIHLSWALPADNFAAAVDPTLSFFSIGRSRNKPQENTNLQSSEECLNHRRSMQCTTACFVYDTGGNL